MFVWLLRRDERGGLVFAASSCVVYATIGLTIVGVGALVFFLRKYLPAGRKAAKASAENKRKSEEQLLAMDFLPIGVFRCDVNGVLTFANECWFSISGQERDSAIGGSCLVSVHPEDRQKVAAAWLRALTEQVPFYSEHRIIGAKGDVRWVVMKASPNLRRGKIVFDYVGTLQDVSDRRAVENALVDSAQRSRVLYRETPFPYVCLSIADGDILDVNPAWEAMTGYSLGEVAGRWIGDFIVTEGLASFSGVDDFLRDHAFDRHETGDAEENQRHFVFSCKDGHERLVSISGGIGYTIQGKASVVHCIFVDITEQQNVQNTILMLDIAVRQSPIAIIVTDTNGAIEYTNPAFSRISGYAPEDVLGRNPRFLKGGQMTRDEYAELWRKITNGETWSGTFSNRRRDGSEYWGESVIAPVRNASGEIAHFIGVMQDITARRTAEDRVSFLAHHDALTKLPNRLLGRERMEWAMAHSDQIGNKKKAALMLIDLDHFKRVNDSLGHSAGDALLREVAERLRSCVRETDTISRQGGDEFLIVLSGVSDTEAIARIADKIMRSMVSSYFVADHEIAITLSIGIAVYPDDGVDYDTLLKRADAAMYNAKEEGRNGYRFFTDKMNIDASEYLSISAALQKAFERNEFVLYYQPQVDLSSNQVIGVESLIRWKHPEWGLVAPGRLIPIAEESGLIVPLGDWILREACRQAQKWRDEGIIDLVVAVNLSGAQFKRGDVLESVKNALGLSGLDPDFLELELTESILMKDTDIILRTVEELKALGVHLSIDDFGTGYSSLSYLKKFNVDKVKIDQSFVRDITTDVNDSAIVHAIVQMAHSLGLRTIAEGVEDEATLKEVRKHQCDEVQGYLYARPLPAEDIPNFLLAHYESAKQKAQERV